jgi:hypothetical protein
MKKMKTKKLLLTAVTIMCFTIFTIGQTVPSYVPTTGLVGWWPFNGNANDSSGNGNSGTVNGATLTSDRFGNPNSAYYFSSASCATRIDVSVNTTSILTGLTIASWVSRSGNGCSGPRFMEFYVPGDGPGSSQWGWDNAGAGSIGSTTSTSFACGVSNWIKPPDNTWTYLVYTNDGVKGRFYQDGVLFNTIPSTGNPILSGNAAFGRMNHPLYDAFNGKLDDIGIWDRSLDSCEIKDLFFASLGNCCNIAVTSQPINNLVNISNNAQFTIASSDPLATYQWQTNLGVGFQNLSSVGQYSGSTNDTLAIANATLSNNNQPFRCIVSSGSCTDTSVVAVLTVLNNVGLNEVSENNLLSVYPNPANSEINVKSDAKMIGTVYNIYDFGGKVVLSGKINSVNSIIELSNLSNGYYLFSVGENLKQTFKVLKE